MRHAWRAWRMLRKMRSVCRAHGLRRSDRTRHQEVWENEESRVVLTMLGRSQAAHVEAEIGRISLRYTSIGLVYDDPVELGLRL